MEEVCEGGAPLYIARENAPTAVMMSERDYEGLTETLHLLSNPASAARLLRSIKAADAGETTEHEN